MLTSIRLSNTGKIPLSLYGIGGLSLILNFVECPIICDRCPWESNIDRRSARLIEFSVQNTISLARQYNVDLIFLHGAEPYTYISYDEVSRLRDATNIPIGLKAIPSIAVDNSNFKSLLDTIDVLLFEIVLYKNIVRQISSLQNIIESSIVSSKHIEIVVVTNINGHLDESITCIVNAVEERGIPINILFSSDIYDLPNINTVISRVREKYPLIQIPVSDVFEYASTPCPRCRNTVIFRRSGIVYKANLDELGRCRVCGYKLTSTKAKKLVKLPLDIPLA